MVRMELDQIQLDALREISSIASANAATGLSTLVGKRVDVTVPNILIETSNRVREILGDEEEIMNAVYFTFGGPFSGSITLVFPFSQSLRLAGLLTGQRFSEASDLDELGISALKELGNIATGTYLHALSHWLNIKVTQSIPTFSTDAVGVILDSISSNDSTDSGIAVIAENALSVNQIVYRAHLILFLQPKAVDIMLRKLGI